MFWFAEREGGKGNGRMTHAFLNDSNVNKRKVTKEMALHTLGQLFGTSQEIFHFAKAPILFPQQSVG